MKAVNSTAEVLPKSQKIGFADVRAISQPTEQPRVCDIKTKKPPFRRACVRNCRIQFRSPLRIILVFDIRVAGCYTDQPAFSPLSAPLVIKRRAQELKVTPEILSKSCRDRRWLHGRIRLEYRQPYRIIDGQGPLNIRSKQPYPLRLLRPTSAPVRIPCRRKPHFAGIKA
jgi:hypothetical protein